MALHSPATCYLAHPGFADAPDNLPSPTLKGMWMGACLLCSVEICLSIHHYYTRKLINPGFPLNSLFSSITAVAGG